MVKLSRFPSTMTWLDCMVWCWQTNIRICTWWMKCLLIPANKNHPGRVTNSWKQHGTSKYYVAICRLTWTYVHEASTYSHIVSTLIRNCILLHTPSNLNTQFFLARPCHHHVPCCSQHHCYWQNTLLTSLQFPAIIHSFMSQQQHSLKSPPKQTLVTTMGHNPPALIPVPSAKSHPFPLRIPSSDPATTWRHLQNSFPRGEECETGHPVLYFSKAKTKTSSQLELTTWVSLGCTSSVKILENGKNTGIYGISCNIYSNFESHLNATYLGWFYLMQYESPFLWAGFT